ncbi:hypothetical protein fsci_16120 [Francisella sciaenopsi]|uniref:Uncharacterized protein n=1 Tax=Francisella sciaenopsi TaxID=3055034 RepID=A0ABQ6PGQ8_9GAMM
MKIGCVKPSSKNCPNEKLTTSSTNESAFAIIAINTNTPIFILKIITNVITATKSNGEYETPGIKPNTNANIDVINNCVGVSLEKIVDLILLNM